MLAGGITGSMMGGTYQLLSGNVSSDKTGTDTLYGSQKTEFDKILEMGTQTKEGKAQIKSEAAQGDIMFSVSKTPESIAGEKRYGRIDSEENISRYAEEVDGVFDGTKGERTPIVAGATPALYGRYGADTSLPITLYPSTVRKMAYPTGYLGLKHGHNLGIASVKHLPEQIADPKAILKSNTQKDSLVLLTEWVDVKEHRVIVPLHLGRDGVLGLENRTASAYGRDIRSLLVDADGKSTVLYTKKDESIDSILASSGLQLPGAPNEDTLINNSISRFLEKSKVFIVYNAGKLKEAPPVSGSKAKPQGAAPGRNASKESIPQKQQKGKLFFKNSNDISNVKEVDRGVVPSIPKRKGARSQNQPLATMISQETPSVKKESPVFPLAFRRARRKTQTALRCGRTAFYAFFLRSRSFSIQFPLVKELYI